MWVVESGFQNIKKKCCFDSYLCLSTASLYGFTNQSSKVNNNEITDLTINNFNHEKSLILA